MTNEKIIVESPGGIDKLKLVTEALSSPKPHQVLVEVAAVGAAYGDIFLRRGIGYRRAQYPMVPGYDLVGSVIAIGQGVLDFAVGDLVAALPMTGGYQSYLNIAADELVRLPTGLEPIIAAASLLNYTTALQLMSRAVTLRTGDNVFVYGIGGPLGQAMMQVAHLLGVTLVGTASGGRLNDTDENGPKVFDRHDGDLVETVMKAYPSGMNVVYDPLGGKSLMRSFSMLSSSGTLVMTGAAGAIQSEGPPVMEILSTMSRFAYLKLTGGKRSVMMYLVADSKKRAPKAFRQDVTTVLESLASGTIAPPPIAAVLPLKDAGKAHDVLERGRPKGKIVLVP